MQPCLGGAAAASSERSGLADLCRARRGDEHRVIGGNAHLGGPGADLLRCFLGGLAVPSPSAFASEAAMRRMAAGTVELATDSACGGLTPLSLEAGRADVAEDAAEAFDAEDGAAGGLGGSGGGRCGAIGWPDSGQSWESRGRRAACTGL